MLNICNAQQSEDKSLNGLELKDIGVNFARKSLNNLQSRFQCLMEGLGSDRIHPKSMFDAFGDIFGDKVEAYRMAMEWREDQEQKQEEDLQKQLDAERERIRDASKEDAGAVSDRGQDDSNPVEKDSE